jgi:predicted ATP-binding protein involved in virulence
MWLRSLHVENFRGFETLDVTFDEHVTLLIGGNGAGKTGVLEAIKVAFGSYFAGIDQSPDQSIDLEHARRVVHEISGVLDLQEQWPVRVSAVADVTADPLRVSIHRSMQGVHVQWSRERAGRDGRTNWGGDAEVRQLAAGYQDAVQAGKTISLPVIACYGTGRLWRQTKVTGARIGIGTRFDGYTDCLDIASSEQLLTRWMYDKRLIELEARESDPNAIEPRLAAVTRAVCDCVEGVTRFWVDLKAKELRFERDGRTESFAMLSDGYRNMIAMVADIAQRAATLNPQFGAAAAQMTTGVVLIDEIELHLHPKWQREVIPSLRRTFPKMQFIATTHSPQVLASVARDQVRLFENNQLVDAELFVEGRSSNELLEDVFVVPARPEATERDLDELFRLLDLENYEAARGKLAELETRLGRDDGAMVRARWILESEAGVESARPAAS